MDFFTGVKIVIDFLFANVSVDPILAITLVIFFIGLVMIAVVDNYVREQKLKKSYILQVDKMPGKVFEEYLKGLLKQRGYKVRLHSVTGDFGANLIITKCHKRIVVQVKRYKKKVGLKAVQEIVSAKDHYNADDCWVITNNYFTDLAVDLAKENNVVLIDRDVLMKWVLELRKVS